MTFHAHLLSLTQDSSDGDWFISVIENKLYEFHIEYLVPKAKQPWENATITGVTKSLDELKDYLIIAMTKS